MVNLGESYKMIKISGKVDRLKTAGLVVYAHKNRGVFLKHKCIEENLIKN